MRKDAQNPKPDLEAPEATKKKPFVEPKLSYVTPKLVERGKVEEVTLQGFFGTFSPP